MNLEKLIIGNAAGTARTIEDVKKLAQSAVTRITVGSITKLNRSGNTGETYYFDFPTGTSLNSIGMRNEGIEWYHAAGKLTLMGKIAHDAGKKLHASVAGFSPKEFAELSETCFLCGVDGVELNLGCPNVHDGGTSKPIFSYHPQLVEEALDEIDAMFFGQEKNIGVKISPVPKELLPKLVNAINRGMTISEVVAVNTDPHRELYKPDKSPGLSYTPQDGTGMLHTGGLAGAPLKAHALRIIEQFKSRSEKSAGTLYSSTRVIGAGGIFSGSDAKEFLAAGADGIMVGTAYYNREDPTVFSDILTELAGLYEPA